MRRGSSIYSAARAGRLRRSSAEAYAGEADLADAQVQLSAEIAKAYIGLRDSQQRLELVRNPQRSKTRCSRSLSNGGNGAWLPIWKWSEKVRTQVENARAVMIPLADEEVAEALDQLALLTDAGARRTRCGACRDGTATDFARGDADWRSRLTSSTATGYPRGGVSIGVEERRDRAAIPDWFPKNHLDRRPRVQLGDLGQLVRSENFMWVGAPLRRLERARLPDAPALEWIRPKAGFEEASAQYESTGAGCALVMRMWLCRAMGISGRVWFGFAVSEASCYSLC